MNVANVIPLSVPYAVPYAKSEHPAAMNPVRVRFDAFELDEAMPFCCATERPSLSRRSLSQCFAHWRATLAAW